ncbi:MULTISPECIES: RHS repeat-associated core domain-containing protein [Vibrio]|uniref:RHS repeat-associated core domain-containing protein n=1 Tax=Vibrio navarrensis TaxID=29495 RepID=A0AAJ4IEQ7_9VIBR|nr:RHS repeat-associated core domain-containing protein [Vibrio navarrensis]QPL55370.1 RHS repeat-associated core domain-containing protein [Vibrio navarrensis]
MSNSSFQPNRRQFLKQTGHLSALVVTSVTLPIAYTSSSEFSYGKIGPICQNPVGFNGVRQDPVTKLYALGNGYRMYNPTLMRFHAQDSLSPFGKGGTNGYAYCLGDPVNRHDPSGHFALLSLLIGAIIGALVGGALSAVSEGIQCAINPEHKFDWKQVGIGAAIGFISGGFGAAAQGAKTSVQVGLAIADIAVSGSADFGLNVAAGVPVKQAGINTIIGAVVGLGTFGMGQGVGKLGKSLSAASQRIARAKTKGLSGKGAVTAGRRFSALYNNSLLDALDLESGLKISKTTGDTLVGFHGTSSHFLDQGIEGGLNLGKMNINGGLSGGKGFYFSLTPSIAKDFAEVATSEFGGVPSLLGVFTSVQQYQGMSVRNCLHIGRMGGGGMKVGYLSELEGIVRPGAYQAVRLRPLKWGYDGQVDRLPFSLESPW